MTTRMHSGLLSLRDYGDAYGVLFLSTIVVPLAEVLDDEMSGKQVAIRYWIADAPCTREDVNESLMRKVTGVAETQFGSEYSYDTGYLGTYEECKIGSHDLMNELRDAVGKWLILEIEVHAQ